MTHQIITFAELRQKVVNAGFWRVVHRRHPETGEWIDTYEATEKGKREGFDLLLPQETQPQEAQLPGGDGDV
jgi:hypothetical protein